MTPEQLKTSVLQYALSGKLVPQVVEEGSAEDLIKKNRIIREQYIEDNKLKKSKILEEISDSEIPYEIPENWKWARIGDYCIDVFSGKSPKYIKTPTEYRIIGQAANQQEGICLDQIKYTNEEFWSDMPERYFIQEYDVLLNTLGNGTLGRSGIIKELPYKLLTDGHLFVFRFTDHTEAMFLYYYFQYKRTEIERAANGSTNQTFLSLGNALSWVIPIPPLGEQHRIVAKIEKLLPYVDRYAEAYEKLEQFNTKFPEDMKKSILQYAIQGKLVEQRPEEGTAEDLYQQIQDDREQRIKCGEIKKDKRASLEGVGVEKPFDIPDSWKWVTLGSILLKLTDGTHKTPKYTEKGIKFVSVKDMSSGVLSLENTKFISIEEHKVLFSRCDPQRGDMLLSKVGTTGVPAIVDTDESFSLFVSVALLKYNHSFVDEKYLYYLLQSPLVQTQAADNTRGVGNKNWVLDAIGKTLIVLPPYKEQCRIVNELERLLPYCDKLRI